MSASSGARSAGPSPCLDIRTPTTSSRFCYVAVSSQKNYCSLYLMGAFWSASQLEQLKTAFKAAGKKLDMGKCCVHFESPDDLPLEAIAS